MFAGAPPMLVVGLVVRVVLVGIQAYTIFAGQSVDITSAAIAGALVGDTMIAAGCMDLARRTRRGARFGTLLAATVYGLAALGVVATSVYFAYVQVWGPEQAHGIDAFVLLTKWAWPLLELAGVLGLALAVDAGGLVFGLLALGITMIARPIPPLAGLFEHLDRDQRVIAIASIVAGQAVACTLLAARIAKRAAPIQRDHLRAARGVRIVIVALVGRSVLGAALAVWDVAGAGRFVVGSHAIDALDVVSAGVLAVGVWRWAQAQLPAMPRYVLHVGVALALAAPIMLARTIQDWWSVTWSDPRAFVPPWWIDLGVTAALGCVVIALLRYARHAPVISRATWLGAFGLVVFAALGVVMRGRDLLPGIYAMFANVTMIPALRATARAIADDPIKSTADVFA